MLLLATIEPFQRHRSAQIQQREGNGLKRHGGATCGGTENRYAIANTAVACAVRHRRFRVKRIPRSEEGEPKWGQAATRVVDKKEEIKATVLEKGGRARANTTADRCRRQGNKRPRANVRMSCVVKWRYNPSQRKHKNLDACVARDSLYASVFYPASNGSPNALV